MAIQSVFERIEEKYRLDARERAAIEGALAAHLQRDRARDGLVCSLYLDTPERAVIMRSLEKPCYKEKLRLRAYGTEAAEALVRAFDAPGARLTAAEAGLPVFVELKKKLDGVGYKRRARLSLGAAQLLCAGVPAEQALAARPLSGERPQPKARQRQIAREIEAYLRRFGDLGPSMAIRCQRQAWVPAEPGACAAAGAPRSAEATPASLRVTFDEAVDYLDLGPRPAAACATAAHGAPASDLAQDATATRSTHAAPSATWRPVLDDDASIMEVKCAGAFPLWLAHALAATGTRPRSLSKYGTAFQKEAAHVR